MIATVQPSTSTIMPPTYFDLKYVHPSQALSDIRDLTNNYTGIKDDGFVENFNENMEWHFETNTNVMFGYIPAPPESYPNRSDIIKKVIGENGHWLKTTTEKAGIHFIWYDKARNNFMFWGPNYYTISRAMNAIRWRIIKYGNFKFDN
jgi:hypothetical protein